MMFELNYKYNSDFDFDNQNPYSIMDGKWGGFSEQLWYTGRSLSLNNDNVYELKRKKITFDKDGTYYCNIWYRYWNHSILQWNPITQDILDILPKNNVFYVKNVRFDKIVIPRFNKKFNNLTTQEILSVQPMI